MFYKDPDQTPVKKMDGATDGNVNDIDKLELEIDGKTTEQAEDILNSKSCEKENCTHFNKFTFSNTFLK